MTPYQSNLIDETSMKVFVTESIESAILDSGTTSTVSDEAWIKVYVDYLTLQKQR